MTDLDTQEGSGTAVEHEQEFNAAEFMADKLAEIRSRQTDEPEAKEQEPEKKPDRPREKDGKFAKTEQRQAKEPEAPQAKPVDAPQQEAKPAEPEAKVYSAVKPPDSFTAAGKAEFAKAPPALQQEILKRETDFHQYYHKTVAPLKQAAQYGQEMYSAIKPYEQTIRQWGATPAQAIQALFEADRKLTHGSPQEKLQAFGALAKGYGIDLSQGLPAQQAVDPNVEYLQRMNRQALLAAQQAAQRTQQLEQRLVQERQAAEQAQLNSVIEQAKQGKPHFDELRVEIGTILQSMANKGVQMPPDEMINQAYEMACWQHPKIRAELLAQQQEQVAAEAAQKRAEDASRAQQARKAASVNVGKRGTLAPQAPAGETKDIIRANLEKIRSRKS